MAAWLTIACKVQRGEPGRTRLINVARGRALPSARRRPDVLQNVSECALEALSAKSSYLCVVTRSNLWWSMDVVQLMKREHTRTIDLIDKLAETSSGAVKTRERVLSQLRSQLEFHTRALQEHVMPELEKHEETRNLKEEVAKGQDQLGRALGELGELPQNDRDFSRKMKELKRDVQQYFREEEKQVWAALKKELSEEEAQKLSGQLAEAKRAEPEDEEQGNGHFEQTLAHARTGVHQLGRELGEMTGQASHAAQAAGRSYMEATQDALESAHALMTVPTAAVRGFQELGTVWKEWLRRASGLNARFSQGLLQRAVEVQNSFVQESIQLMRESNAQTMEISRRFVETALRPVEEQVERTGRSDAD